ncbi:hypothetical protein JCM19047_3038 [Bacillus sp. JCM 19047]|nr:hypothetical protein JCM19047_3038 [Bacillus sp. JCM 19047]
MKEFVFFLKRDIRLLVPINVIIAILFTIMLVIAGIIRMRLAEPFQLPGVTAVPYCCFFTLYLRHFSLLLNRFGENGA